MDAHRKRREFGTMKLKLFVLLLFATLFITMVSAGETRFIGKQDLAVDIKEPCFNNGTYCSASTLCNVTVWRPNQDDILVNNKPMSHQGSYFNYTMNGTITNTTGEYETSVSCCLGEVCDFDTFFFRITPSGHLYEQSESLMYGIILLVIFLISGFFLFMMKQTEEPGVKLFFGLIGFILIIAGLGAARIFMDYTSLTGGIITIINSVLYVVAIVFIVTMYYVFVNQTRRAIELMRAKEGWGDIETPRDF